MFCFIALKIGDLGEKMKYAHILYTKWDDPDEIFYQFLTIVAGVSWEIGLA